MLTPQKGDEHFTGDLLVSLFYELLSLLGGRGELLELEKKDGHWLEH